MSFLRKKEPAPKTPNDGPEEWAAKARQIDEQVEQERLQQMPEKIWPDVVHELSSDYLKHMLNDLHASKGKFLRVGDIIIVGPAKWGTPGTDRQSLFHDRFFDVIAQNQPELRARLADAQMVANFTGKALVNPASKEGEKNADGVEDGGYFLLDEKNKGGDLITLMIGGRSGTYGMADDEGRQHTIELVKQALGPNVDVLERDFIA